jgi:hypothetical protein
MVVEHGTLDNQTFKSNLRRLWRLAPHMAIEMIASYGMAVGVHVFETCVWIGRYIELWDYFGSESTKVYRSDVKMHLCKSNSAADSNVRAALIDRFGPGKAKAVGVTKARGPLFGIKGDEWAALGVAVTYQDGAAVRHKRETG